MEEAELFLTHAIKFLHGASWSLFHQNVQAKKNATQHEQTTPSVRVRAVMVGTF